MMTKRLQDVSYLCDTCILNTTHMSSNAWVYYYKQLGFKVGSLKINNNYLNFWIVPTRIGGTVIIFPHIAKNLFLQQTILDQCDFDEHKAKIFLQEFVRKVKTLSLRYNASAVKITPFVCNNDKLKKLLKDFGFVRDPKSYDMASWHAYVLFIPYESIEELLQTFRKTTRYEIRKALKSVATEVFLLSKMPEKEQKIVLNNFYNKYNEFITKYTKHKPLTRNSFNAIIAGILRDNETDVLFVLTKLQNLQTKTLQEFDITRKNIINEQLHYVKDNRIDLANTLLGVSMFILYNNNMFYFLSASNKATRKVSALYANVFKAMEWGFNNKYYGMSLWGINLEHQKIKSWQGFSLFKKGFHPEVARLIGPYLLVTKPRGWLYLIREYIADLMVKY